MEAVEWIERCAERLRQQWPSVATSDLDEIACELWNEREWRQLEPEVAALRWLQQGIPSAA
ncbi:MAG TPA: hypothetical protein VN680_02505 [Burkholderiaceae bacterium]|jgi:hypothetical protein|nr:hypothetical protein [Burkholderiaceae bacterium]